IMGMHHDQDIRNMGGLRKYMPITWITALIGSLALIGTPFLSGFYSKDSIIEAVGLSHLPGSGFAYFAVVAGVFVTAFYSFRMYFLVFHGKERFQSHAAHGDHGHGGKPHESPWVVTLPLILLAIPSAVIGYITIQPMLFGDYFQGAIFVSGNHPAMQELMHEFHGAFSMAIHALTTLPFWLALAGAGTAWFFYMKRPDIPEAIKQRFSLIYSVLERKYGFDEFNDWFFAGGARLIGRSLWKGGDVAVIDGFFVNGTARMIGWFSTLTRRLQSGYIYHYTFAMIIGVFVLMTLFVKG
ncbi:MAG: NADH-quinone oxidoreductase subunit L, partial [Gammaproteobacteria bacterium]|nr:NADH-quinone oxidoreductase subunit L [Gammaproteobacteria bacterium]